MNPKNTRKHIVVLTGAGISAESGLQTFRGDGGLWKGHSVYEVATPEAWESDPQLVLDFYNMRRQAVRKAQPNAAHELLAALEDQYQVTIVTQNVDDLHERAGSTRVIHLHGEILKGQSSRNPTLIVDLAADIALGDLAPDGAQLRPHVVWFGEMIRNWDEAAAVASSADLFVIIGTSLQVYPAASLIHYIPPACPLYLIDREVPESLDTSHDVHVIKSTATEGMRLLQEELTDSK